MPKAARNKARRPLALAANCVFSEDPPTVIATNLLRKPTFESVGLSPWNSELFSFSKPSLAPSLLKGVISGPSFADGDRQLACPRVRHQACSDFSRGPNRSSRPSGLSSHSTVYGCRFAGQSSTTSHHRPKLFLTRTSFPYANSTPRLDASAALISRNSNPISSGVAYTFAPNQSTLRPRRGSVISLKKAEMFDASSIEPFLNRTT